MREEAKKLLERIDSKIRDLESMRAVILIGEGLLNALEKNEDNKNEKVEDA